MKPTTGYALPYSDDRCFFLFKNSMRSLFKPMRKNHSDQLISLCAQSPHSQALAD